MKLKLSELKETKSQRDHGDLSGLKQSIQEVGLINPLTINHNKKLLAGRRRYQVVKELGWKEVDCRILNSKDALTDFKISIEENLKRKSLTDLEVASAIKDYDELKRKLYGESISGRRTDLQPASTTDIGWNTDKTAKDLGISSGSVRTAIQIAKAVEERPELAKLKKGKQILRKLKIDKQKDKFKQLKKPTGLFDIIVVDPPWEFRMAYDPDFGRGEGDYPTMTLEEIKEIKLPAKKDCVLWLWITNNMILEGFEVLEAWGYTFRNILTWDKEMIGIGAWLRNQTEHCLMATKGKPLMNLTNQSTILREKRTKHSSKPEIFYKMIEKLCIGEKLDYFARRERNGWSSYGDEV